MLDFIIFDVVMHLIVTGGFGLLVGDTLGKVVFKRLLPSSPELERFQYHFAVMALLTSLLLVISAEHWVFKPMAKSLFGWDW
jgi:hypothetical protein